MRFSTRQGLSTLATALLCCQQRALAAVPFNLRNSTQIFSHPNATGEITIPGFDLRKPYPGTQVDGWKLSIRVTAQLPLDSSFVTVSGITYTAPQQLLQKNATDGVISVERDPSWFICQHFFNATALENISTSVNADCSGTIPDQCITDLKKRLQTGFGVREEIYQCANPIPLPDSCVTPFGTTAAASHAVENAVESFNGSSSFTFSSTRHAESNFTSYNIALTKVWVVGTVWASGNTTLFSKTTPFTSLNCIRAGNVSAGSRAPENAAIRLHVDLWSWVAAFAAVAVALVA